MTIDSIKNPNILNDSCEHEWYWIYTLSEPESNNVRYVGISKQPLVRLKQHLKDVRSNKHKHNWLKKINFNPKIELISLECSKEEAIQQEKNLILEFRKKGNKLINKTIGGDYYSGSFKSSEVIEKLRQSKLGDKNPNYGKTPSEETKRKLSKSLKGRKFSEIHLAKLREINQRNSRKVFQYNLDGDFINEYQSISEAAKIINGNISKISSCALGKRKSTSGFQWSFEKKNKIEKYAVKKYKTRKDKGLSRRKHKTST